MDLTSNKSHTLDTITPQPTNTHTPKSLSFANGTLKRHPTAAAPPPTMAVISYKDCLKNHAASIGGHALDGCGEFMASSSTNPADPRSLKCAACGCHRNFHRRVPPEPSSTTTTTTTPPQNPNFINCFYSPTSPTNAAPAPPPPQPLPHRGMSQSTSPSLSSSPSQSPSPMSSPSSPPPLSHVPPYHHHSSAAPHMLLALGSAYSAPPPPQQQSDQQQEQHYRSAFTTSGTTCNSSKKRYRTKFSQEQKEKMLSFSEKLGWRMNKGDDVAVQEFCNDIGVPRGVFKVWMHNNKNSFRIKRSDGGNYLDAPPPPPPPHQNSVDQKMSCDDGGGNDGNNRVPCDTTAATANGNVHVPIPT